MASIVILSRPTMEALLRDRRLLYVTGKGGVGKTTVAAALGLAAANAGRRTIVCEVAEQDRVSRAFRRQGVVAETEVMLADNLWAITIDPQRAMEEWLARQVGGAGLRVLARSSAFQYFVAAAPGAKELITVAKVWELAQTQRWDRRNRTYDLVVVDAPSSGYGLAMLTTPRTFGEIARVGPIRRQAFRVRDLLADPERTGYVAVALPEEMPVNETLELERRLPEAVGTGLEAIVVNGMWPERFSAAEADTLRANSGFAVRNASGDATSPPLRAALTAYERARGQRSQLRRLRRGSAARVVTLPYLFGSEVGLPEYETLAAALARKL
jgi:anion-transporting  ArsA/GET3 family ATPase